MPQSWRDIVAARTSHRSGGAGAVDSVARAERALRAAGHDAIEDASNTLADQTGRRLRAWGANRDGLSAETAADLDRQRSSEMWSIRHGMPVEGSPVGAPGPESLAEANKALSEQLGYDIDLSNMPKPGTPEFVAKYCQPPEPIERVVPNGSEGFSTIKCDVDGTPLTGSAEPLRLEGPGPSRGTPGYAPFDNTPKAP